LFGREEIVIQGIVKVDGRQKHNGTVFGATHLLTDGPLRHRERSIVSPSALLCGSFRQDI